MSKTVTAMKNDRLTAFVTEAGAHQYVTPYMLTNLDVLTKRSREFRKEFPGMAIYYAVKCFADDEVIEAVDSYVDGYDVASIEEVKAVLKLGVDPLRLAFSNPIKSDQALRTARTLGVKRFAYQNYDELVKIKRYVPDAEVYLRVKVADAASELSFSSKFGCKPTQALELLQQAVAVGLEPVGITFHVGSQATANRVWPNAITIAAQLMREARSAGIKLTMLNLGGGFPVQYSPTQPSLAGVASVINNSLKKNFQGKRPQLMAEPGRYLVADSSTIITTIIGIEKRDSSTWLYLDIGAFQAFIEIFEFGYFPYPVYSLRHLEQDGASLQIKQYVLSGPSCDSFDTMTRDISLPADLSVGDRLVIDKTGAYTVVYGSNFNGFNIPRRYFFTGKGVQ